MVTMPAGVVVPLDGSKTAEAAVPVAAVIAKTYGLPVQFVHVLAGEDGTEVARANDVLREYVGRLTKSAGIAEGSYSGAVVEGQPARAILDFAKDARFIVISTHGRGGFRAAVIGSVADKVVRGSDVPVLLVPATGEAADISGGPVLVGLDGSPVAEKGLAAGRELAGRLKLKVVLLRSYSMPPAIGMEFGTYPADLLPALKETSEEYLNGISKPGEEKYTALDSPALALQEGAEKLNAGLIVLTSHGKGFAERLALGSTTDRVMHSSKRVMLIVPVGAD
jgi:nucleotide-binding universal stress UspA family protein